MNKTRLEAFSDGVIAILITIMVLELKVPHEGTWHALQPLLPVFLAYVLSFTIIGIYWNNHHHLLHTAEHVTAGIMWANLHLLFWLSLMPFTTGWMGENHAAALPTAVYAVNLEMGGVAFLLLKSAIIRAHGPQSRLARAVGADLKGKASALLYLASIPLAYVEPLASDAIFVVVAAMWFIPDRRIERVAHE